jgi:class 3 adenylate cyclase
MESHGEPGKIHLSDSVAKALGGKFPLVDRGTIEVKGTGAMRTYFLGDLAS